VTEASPSRDELSAQNAEVPAVRIWRYMNFTKFVSMIDTGALYFSRLDLLGDPFEGSIPRANRAYWQQAQSEHPDKAQIVQSNEALINDFVRDAREHIYVNCWHVNEHESAAMWHLYAREGASIAVESNRAMLRALLPERVAIDPITYIDYLHDSIPPFNILNFCKHKRKSFDHERELRAHIWNRGMESGTHRLCWEGTEGAPGIVVPVDVPRLVKSVVVAPGSDDWFLRLVGRVLEKYGLPLGVRRSQMDDEPVS
jgi:hypothetical protein